MRQGWFGLMAAGLLGGCMAVPEKPQISGTAGYRERIALPDDAVLDVVLEDVSRADSASEVLGAQEIDRAGQPPIAFTIPYDPARIDPGHRYVVRGTISVRGEPLFVTTQAHPVLTQGAGDRVELVLERTRGAAAAAAATGDKPLALAGPVWRLASLNGQAVPSGEHVPELQFSAEDNRVAGSGGCNRIAGSYRTLTDTALDLSGIIGTKMACPDRDGPSEDEFLAALGQVRSYAIEDGMLRLTGDGVALAFRPGNP
ncbi:YbaY family lipoprotein [Geminicoccus roseus]|uniref:YbaY family lipoprotein n=1 Tax=Geminicoccus roseus TaxID=404900 RepID=UPI0004088951|nr:YbaY family lipoprotein [Geminicoccus roseus]